MLLNKPLDILVSNVGHLALVVDGQQRDVSIVIHQDGEGQHSRTAALALSLGSYRHTYLTDTSAKTGALQRIFAEVVSKSQVIITQRLVFLGETFKLAKDFFTWNDFHIHLNSAAL